MVVAVANLRDDRACCALVVFYNEKDVAESVERRDIRSVVLRRTKLGTKFTTMRFWSSLVAAAREGNEINTAIVRGKIGFAPADLLYSESLTKSIKSTISTSNKNGETGITVITFLNRRVRRR